MSSVVVYFQSDAADQNPGAECSNSRQRLYQPVTAGINLQCFSETNCTEQKLGDQNELQAQIVDMNPDQELLKKRAFQRELKIQQSQSKFRVACLILVITIVVAVWICLVSLPKEAAALAVLMGLFIATMLISDSQVDDWEADNLERLISNSIGSHDNKMRLDEMIASGDPYAIFFRQFSCERSPPEAVHVTTPGPAGGTITLRYQHSSEIYNRLIGGIASIVPVFELLNTNDYSRTDRIVRFRYGDDWQSAVLRYASIASIIVVYGESWSAGLEWEVRWVKDNSFDDRSIIIATPVARRILEEKGLMIDNIVNLPPESELAMHRRNYMFANSYGIDSSKVDRIASEVNAMARKILQSRRLSQDTQPLLRS